MSVPFRLIAIASDAAGVDAIAATAGANPAVTIAMMLRDPEQDESVVTGLLAYARARASSNIVLSTNGVACDGVRWVHLPYRRRDLAAPLRARGFGVGISVHSQQEAAQAVTYADYLLASPIFPTPSKPGHRGIGLDRLEEICSNSPVPVFALGGIDAKRAGTCLAHGAYGIAGISVFRSADESNRTIATITRMLSQYAHG